MIFPADPSFANAKHGNYKAQLMLEIYKRFTKEYIDTIMGEPLKTVWAITSGLCAPSEDVRWILNRVKDVKQTEKAQKIIQLDAKLESMLDAVIQHSEEEQGAALERLGLYYGVLEAASKNLMRDLRKALLVGIRAFEEFEGNTVDLGGGQLLDAIKSMPTVLDDYYIKLFDQIDALESGDK